jgi:hypothetical protein
MYRHSITREGEGVGAMMLSTFVSSSRQNAAPFNFHLLFYMAKAPSSTSTLIAFFIFISRRQLQSSSPT